MRVFTRKTLIKWYEPAGFRRQDNGRAHSRFRLALKAVACGLVASLLFLARVFTRGSNANDAILSPQTIIALLILAGLVLGVVITYVETLPRRISVRTSGVMWHSFQHSQLIEAADIEEASVCQARINEGELSVLVLRLMNGDQEVFGLSHKVSIDTLMLVLERIGIAFHDDRNGRVMDLSSPRPSSPSADGNRVR
jgi:hypothetical protein